MAPKLSINKSGGINLPKSVRDELSLAVGDQLTLETSGGQITLRPVRKRSTIHKKHGVWVFRAGKPLSDAVVQKTLREVRSGADGKLEKNN